MKLPPFFRGLLALLALASLRAQPEGTRHVFTLAGKPGQAFNPPSDGVGGAAGFSLPAGVAVARSGDIFFCDSYNQRVCKITLAGVVTTIASGATTGGLVQNPTGIAVDEATGDLYVADWGTSTIQRISPQGAASIIAGARASSGYLDGDGELARFNYPRGVALLGDYIYVTDSGNHVIRRIHKTTRIVSTLAGAAGSPGLAAGLGSIARFSQPWGIAIDPTAVGGGMVVTDAGNGAIRRVTAGGFAGILTTGLVQPTGIAADATGTLYVANTYAHTVDKVTEDGRLSTLAGTRGEAGLVDGPGPSARFNRPNGLAVDSSGRIFVADTGNAVFRVIVQPAPVVISGSLAPASAEPGGAAELGPVAYTSPVAPTFQWLKDGAPIAGATGPTLRIFPVQAADAGEYTLRLTTAFGTQSTNAASLVVRTAPVLSALPSAQTLTATDGTRLIVHASGSGPLAYQWYRGGVPLAGATFPVFTATLSGLYTVEVSNAFGRTRSTAIAVLPAKRLVNLSARGVVRGTAQTMIGGLAVFSEDGRDKTFLIRAVGPGLAAFGVTSNLPHPSLTVFRGTVPIAGNTQWSTGDAERIAAAAREVGAFALNAGSADAALHATLAPGSYTLEVSGLNGAEGSALLEVYELASDLGRLVNLSTRGTVAEGRPLTAGIVVRGSAPAKLLIRAVGPGLAPFGVTDALSSPRLTLYSGSVQTHTNAGWNTATSAAEIATAAAAAGAFALAPGSQDAALLLTLPPGSYTAEITTRGGSGTALVEVYEVP